MTYAIRNALEVLGDSGYDEDIRRAAIAELDDLEAERDHWRSLVEKVGVVDALRGLVAAAEPLCGKLEVIPGRAKLPPEFYPAAAPSIQVLREAVAIARAALGDEV